MSHPLPPKKEVALALLERSSVHVHLDPRGTGVVVPPWFKRQPQLVLQVGLNMPVPIPDLRLDDDGLSCTLSFNRAPFYCVVPWGSVFAMIGEDGRGMVWPDEVPPEIASQRATEGAARERDGAPTIRRVPDEPEKADSKRGKQAGAPATPRVAPVPRAVSSPEQAREERDNKAEKIGKPEKPAPIAAKGRRAKKKRGDAQDDARPQLVAVPPADPQERSTQGASGPSAVVPPHPVRPVPAPAPRAVPSPRRAPTKKRELPPYLRVVK